MPKRDELLERAMWDEEREILERRRDRIEQHQARNPTEQDDYWDGWEPGDDDDEPDLLEELDAEHWKR